MSFLTNCAAVELDPIGSGEGCVLGGITVLRVATGADIDIAATGYDAATSCITSLAANAARGFVDISFDIENAEFKSTKAAGEFLWTNELTITVKGRSKARWNAIVKMCQACPLIIYVADRNCNSYVAGISRNVADDAFVYDNEPLQMTTAEMTTGNPAGNSQNTFTLMSKSLCPSLMSTVALAAVPTL